MNPFRRFARRVRTFLARTPDHHSRKRPRTARPQFDVLEERVLLSISAPPDQVLLAGDQPLDVVLGRLDSDALLDLVALDADGRLTVALNNGNDRWRGITALDLGTGPAHGIALGLFGDDPFLDLAVQGSDQITIARGDGNGGFSLSQTLTPGLSPGALAPLGGGRVRLAAGLLDADFRSDLAVPAPGTNQVLVFLGQSNGALGTATAYDSGGAQPVAVAAANFIGDGLPDLAVGHRDGSVTFLEGRPGGFVLRPELTVTDLGAITDLAAADFDGDGETELAVSAGDRVTVLRNGPDLLTSSPITNGDFSAGLTGWNANGPVSAGGGVAQFLEGDSLLTNLQQTFVVPPSPEQITFDIVALGLEDPSGGVPDAFEVSLLDANGNSLVPTFRSEATSFFNANAGGDVRFASDVSFDGRRVTLDISNLTPGAQATLIFDLVGNPPGATSVAAIDNVAISPDVIRIEAFSLSSLEGPFTAATGLATGDVDGDGNPDLVVADGTQIVVFNGDGLGAFTRDEFDTSLFGADALAVAAGPLTDGDTVDDIAVTLFGSGRVLSSLVADLTPPQATVLDPQPGALLARDVSRIEVAFSEAMRDAGPAGGHSVTNPAGYALYASGPNGVFEGGAGDDVTVPLAAVLYDPATFRATLVVAEGSAPLADGRYQVVVKGVDPLHSHQDLAANPLGGGADAVSTFTVDTTPPTITLQLSPNVLWTANHQLVGVNAQISTQDALDPNPVVSLVSITSSEADLTADPSDLANDIQNAAFGSDDRNFSLRAERFGSGARNYTVTYLVRDAAGNGRLVSGLVTVPPAGVAGASSITSNFNGTAIAAGRTVWFNSVLNATGLGSAPVTVRFVSQTISFSASGIDYTLLVPDATITFSPAVTIATTSFDAVHNRWVTTLPSSGLSGNQFLSALAFPVVTALPGGIDDVTWAGQFLSDTSGVSVNWKWAAAVYTTFSTDYNAVGVKPVDDNSASQYQNSDHAGAPEAFKPFVIGGARGGGGSNWTGSYSGTGSVAPTTGASLAASLGNPTPPGTSRLQTSTVSQINNSSYPGGVVVCAIAQPGEVDVWSFQGTAGQRLFFDAQAGSSAVLHWSLADPQGNILFNRDFADQGVLTLTTTGTYYLTVDARAGQTSSYQFRVWDVPTITTTPISFGQAVGNSIGVPGEQDRYTFSGAAGQRLFFDVQGSASGALAFTLLEPNGAALFSRTTQDQGAFTLPAAGTYTVIVGSAGALDATGNYQFRVLEVPADVPQTVAFGDTITGAITAPGETRTYEFRANIGQSILLDVLSNGVAAGFTLLDPLGEVVFSGQPGDQTVVSLRASGTYTLVVDAAGDATGAFSFRLVDQTAPPPVVGNAGPAAGSTLPDPGSSGRPVPPIDFAALRDVTTLGQLTYTGTTFNRKTETLHAAMQLTNVASDPLGNLVVMAFDGFTPPAAYLANPDTTQPDDGRPLVVYTTADFGPDGLRPGETSAAVALRFGNPDQVRFGFDTTLLAPGNRAPTFTTTPTTDVRVGEPYAYDAAAFDPDGDTLTFRLLVAPAGMTVNPASGLVQWTPTADQAGTQSVILTVEDGRGGSDTQTFTLRFPVVAPPPVNAPPVIVSTPPGMMLVNGQAFAYDVHAIDPDGDAVRYLLGDGPAGMTIDPTTGLINWTASGGVSQWASTVIAFSTQFTGTNWAAHQATGAPNTFSYGDIPTAWAPLPANGAPQFITLGYTTPVHASGVTVRETFGNGFVTQIDVVDTNNDLHTVWTGTDPSQPNTPVDFLVSFPTTSYLVKGVKVYVDINHSGSWEEIDAVALHGTALADVTVVAEDGRGGFDTQSFTLEVVPVAGGVISGTKYNDLNNNGIRDAVDVPPPPTTPFVLTQISTPFNSPVGIDYHVPTNTVVLSVNYSGGQPRNFERVLQDGTHVPFSNVAGFTDEVKIATVRPGNIGGFVAGDLFVGNGQDGQIVRITDGGNMVINSWVSLPGNGNGLMRGSLYVDRTGVFGGDLIVVTTAGEVWRVTSAGVPTKLADVNTHLEGVNVVPNDPARYGPIAGRIISGAEEQGRMYAIDAAGNVAFYGLGVNIEDIDLIPANENFFGVNFGSSKLLGAPASAFSSMVGDFLLTQENVGGGSGLFRLFWDGTALRTQQLVPAAGSSPVSQWEHVTFAPAGIVELPPGPREPGLPNWTIYLDLNENGRRDPEEPTAVTDANGSYQFSNLAPGTYVVAEEPQLNWDQTAPVTRNWTVTVTAALVKDIDFGNHTPAGENHAPVLSDITPPDAHVNEIYQFTAEAADLDGDTLTFSLGQHPAGMVLDPARGTLVWFPTAAQVGTHTFTVTVADGRGGFDTRTYSVDVVAGAFNHGPIIVTQPVTTALPGTAYAYAVEALDPEGDDVAYVLTDAPAGMTIDVTSGLITWTPAAGDLGDHDVTVRVGDGRGGFDSQTYTVTVTNAAPVEIRGTKYYDRNGNGIKDGDLGFLLVSSSNGNSVLRYDAATGLFAGAFVSAGSGGLVSPHGLAYGSDGNLYVASLGTDSVLRYNGTTGAFLGTFVTPGSGGLAGSHGIVFGPDGNLYVAGWISDNVLRYNGQTGAFIDVFASHPSLDGPTEITFGPDGELYVGGFHSDNVLRFDGQTGAFIDVFFPAFTGGLDGTDAVTFGSDGDLYVGSRFTNSVLRYDGATGAFLGSFASGGGLSEPFGVAFGLDGDLYVASRNTNNVLRYDGATGAFDEIFATGGLNRPTYLLFTQQATAGPHGPGIQPFRTVFNTDFVSAGFGGMRGVGTGQVTVTGVTGAVTRAYLYWHGPTNSASATANAAVTFAGVPIVGTQIGFSADNLWGFQNSQAYRADVTSLVTGNGAYALANFFKPGVEINGVSLQVFFDDGDSTNNKDVVLFDGNDSNVTNSFDAFGWNVTLPGINYTSGTARIEMHVSDGQTFTDEALILNGATLQARGNFFDGNTTPRGTGGVFNGSLWDIRSFDITSFLQPGANTLTLTTGHIPGFDALSLISAAVVLPAGAAPEAPLAGWTVYLDQNRNNQLDEGEPFQVTDALGNYSFTGLPADTYVVAEVLQPDWVQVTPDPERVHTLTLPAGAVATGIDFGNRLAADAGANQSPAFTSEPVTTASAGQLYIYHAAAHDPDGDALTFTLVGGPAGMVVHPASGLVVWVPDATQAGSHQVSLQVRDARGAIAVQDYTIDVVGIGSALSITSTPPLVASVGAPYAYAVTTVPPELDASFEFLDAPDDMTIDPDTGAIAWTPQDGDEGSHLVIIRASDIQGGTAFQSYVLEVRPLNVSPTVDSPPVTTAVAGTTYHYLVQASDPADPVTFSLDVFPDGMTIDPRTGNVVWETDAGDVGTHPVVILVTDDRGLSVTQTFTLTVSADTQPPSVVVLQTTNLANPGDSVTVQVVATDNVAVTTLSLTLNGAPLTLDANHTATFTVTTPGLLSLVANATDPSGNIGAGTASVRVFDPADTTAPDVTITSPLSGDTVTYLTPVVGTVTDQHLEFYTLEYALAGTGQWVEFARGTTQVVNGPLGTLDPTLLANGDYDLRVAAQDINGHITYRQISVGVSGNAKLGNFRWEFTDLSVPLAGLPITVKRIYDTLQADESGDFGFGWKLSVADPHIRETVPVTGNFFGQTPFKMGTRVYLTGPDGRRIGFTFDPVSSPGLLGTIWRPRFIPDPGVFETLEVDPITLSQRPNGTFGLYLFGFAYNPDNYTLTTKDGAKYRYNQFSGLQTITDLNGNVLTFSSTGIVSSTGVSIQFVRDADGRVKQLIDPAGNAINYTYDAHGDLVGVVDQAGAKSHYDYSTAHPHYLIDINNATGACGCFTSATPVRIEYDDNGRVLGTSDALGNTSLQTYDPNHFTETTTDGTGHTTTLVYDAQGNVVSTTTPLGGTYHAQYDSNNSLSSLTDPNGHTTRWTRDSRGNVLSMTDAMGNTWTFTYNSLNRMTSAIDPRGKLRTYDYDSRGNLIHLTGPDDLDVDPDAFATYDAQGRMISFTDANGYTTTYQYGAGAKPTLTTHPDGTTKAVQYDVFQRPIAITDEDGRTAHYVFDNAAGQITAVIDPDGHQTTITYRNQKPATVTDALGRVTRLTYDAADRLTSITDPDGNTSYLGYDANSRLTSITDRLGHTTRVTYDAGGNVLTYTNALGETTTYGYDAAGNRTSLTDALGRATDYTYDARRNQLISQARSPDVGLPALTESFTYDSLGNQSSYTDANGHTTLFVYSDNSRLISQTDALGFTIHYGYDNLGDLTSMTDALGNTTAYQFNSRGRQVAMTDPLGHVTRYGYDGVGNLTSTTDQLGRTTQFAYDGENRLTRQIDALGGQISFQYDAVGNRTAATDELGRTTRYTYDRLNHLVSAVDALDGENRFTRNVEGYVTTWTDALDRTWSYSYDALNRPTSTTNALGFTQSVTFDAVGNISSQTDQLGRVTRYGYDALNRGTSVTDALGGVQRYAYDGEGNMTSSTDQLGRTSHYAYDAVNNLTSDTDPLGHVWTYTYNGNGQRTSQVDARGGLRQFSYDALNRITAQTDPTGARTQFGYDAVGNQTSVVDPLGRQTQYGYDALHQLTSITDPTGGVTHYAFDAAGNITSSSDQLGRTRTYTVDALNRLTAHTDPEGHTTQSRYDAVGNQISVTDPKGNVTQFGHDALNRVIQQTNPLGYSSFYTFDAVGNMTSTTDANGRERTFTYDALNRVTAENWLAGITIIRTMSYSHDAVGNLLSASDPDSSYTFTYDALNRTTSVDNAGTPGLPHVVLNYGYDATGNLTSVGDNLGVQVTATYDGRNLVTGFQWVGLGSGLQPNITLTRDAAGQLTQLTRVATTGPAASTVTGFTHDALGRLTDLTHSNSSAGGLASYHYTYDAASQLTSETHHGQTAFYTYDRAGQVLTATYGSQPNEQYAYDSNGNRIGAAIVTGTDNRLQSDATFDYIYDRVGNLISKTERATGEVTTYTYDYRNRLTQVQTRSSGGVILSESDYTYDVLDRRIATTVNGAKLVTVYDRDHAWADFDAAGQILARYLFGAQPNEIMARWQPTEGLSWYLTDHLGTVRDLVNGSGQLINTLMYSVFGQLLGQTNAPAGDRFTFTGQEFDLATGLYYFKARFYDPATGRFVSQDPLGLKAGDYNLYRYVFNAATNATDPTGKLTVTEYGVLIGAIAGVLTSLTCSVARGLCTGDWNVPCIIYDAVMSGIIGGILGGVIARFATPFLQTAIALIGIGGTTLNGSIRIANAAGRAGEQCSAFWCTVAQLVVPVGVARVGAAIAPPPPQPPRGTNTPGQVTSRGSYRQQTLEDAWDNAAPGPNGGRLCPDCGREVMVPPPNTGRSKRLGHRSSAALDDSVFPPNVTREQVLDNYQEGTSLRCIPCNRADNQPVAPPPVTNVPASWAIGGAIGFLQNLASNIGDGIASVYNALGELVGCRR